MLDFGRPDREADQAGACKERAERHGNVLVGQATDREQDEAEYRTHDRRDQHNADQIVGTEPRTQRREQLEIAVAHAFLACCESVGVIDQPEAQVPENSAPHGHGQRDAGEPERRSAEPEPQEDVVEGVRKQLRVQVDEELTDQQCGERGPEPARPGHTVAPCAQREECGGNDFDDRVARADRRLACRAAATQQQVADDGNVFVPVNAVAALPAARAWDATGSGAAALRVPRPLQWRHVRVAPERVGARRAPVARATARFPPASGCLPILRASRAASSREGDRSRR